MRRLLLPFVALVALVTAPLAVYPAFLMHALCMAIFASAFNLLLGYGGLLSFGHAAFFGWAAYAAAHGAKVWGWPPELALLAGLGTGAALGASCGALAIRRKGISFAMITLALAQMTYFIALRAPFAHSEDGIQNVPRGALLGVIDLTHPAPMYYFVLAIYLVAQAGLFRIVYSPFGHVLRAIRENETRAISMGYHAARCKWLAFVLSAALSGLAGALNALIFQSASLGGLDWHLSGEVVLMTLIGGVGSFFGPTIGAFVLVGLQDLLAGWSGWVSLLQGLAFVACVLSFREGIAGALRKQNSARRKERTENLTLG